MHIEKEGMYCQLYDEVCSSHVLWTSENLRIDQSITGNKHFQF